MSNLGEALFEMAMKRSPYLADYELECTNCDEVSAAKDCVHSVLVTDSGIKELLYVCPSCGGGNMHEYEHVYDDTCDCEMCVDIRSEAACEQDALPVAEATGSAPKEDPSL